MPNDPSTLNGSWSTLKHREEPAPRVGPVGEILPCGDIVPARGE